MLALKSGKALALLVVPTLTPMQVTEPIIVAKMSCELVYLTSKLPVMLHSYLM